MPERQTRKPASESGTPAERKPYEKPRIVHREPVEAMATTCSAQGSKTGVGDCVQVGS